MDNTDEIWRRDRTLSIYGAREVHRAGLVELNRLLTQLLDHVD